MPHQLSRAGHRPSPRAMALLSRGRALAARGKLEASLRFFAGARDEDPLCLSSYLCLAAIELRLGRARAALARLEAVAGLDHARLPAYRELATPSDQDVPGLLDCVEAFLGRFPGCAWAHVLRAFSLRGFMRYEEAIRESGLAIACEPRSAALWALRARFKLLSGRGRYTGVADLRRAAWLEPGWGWIHCWLGEGLRHLGDAQAALAALERGLSLDPAYRPGWAWRGAVLVALGRHREAIAALDRALSSDPLERYDPESAGDQRAWALNQRMAAWRGSGETGRAFADLNRAHALGPRYGWVLDPGRGPEAFEEAVAELDRWLGRRPRSAWAYAWRGWTNLRRESFEESLRDLQRCLGLAPGLAWPWAWQGKALIHLGDSKAAGKALERSLALDPRYAPAWGYRAQLRRGLGRLAGAERDFSRSLRLDFRSAWAYAGRGECREKQGRLREALRDLDSALALYPAFTQARAWRAEARRRAGDRRGELLP